MDQLEWQCPVCTLLNKASSYKCRMCGTPKGTSTRQSKHTVTFQQQYLAESLHKGTRSYNRNTSLPGSSGTTGGSASSGKRKLRVKPGSKRNDGNRSWPTLNDIDRSTGKSYSVTVGSVTVVITEYRQITSNEQLTLPY